MSKGQRALEAENFVRDFIVLFYFLSCRNRQDRFYYSEDLIQFDEDFTYNSNLPLESNKKSTHIHQYYQDQIEAKGIARV